MTTFQKHGLFSPLCFPKNTYQKFAVSERSSDNVLSSPRYQLSPTLNDVNSILKEEKQEKTSGLVNQFFQKKKRFHKKTKSTVWICWRFV